MAYAFKYGDRPLEGITVQRAVGRGGFGEVYYAITDAGKQVALKYLRQNPEIELRGVGHVMNINSPYLVKIYDVQRDEDDTPIILMEYVSGPSLRDVMRAESRGLEPGKAVFLTRGIAEGVGCLHRRGVVHRDLKPGNIFYDDGYVKIGDYGLSKHMSLSQHSGQTVSVGTVHYMAPEIGTGHYTKLIDIYAMGVILYEMLAGRLPFTGGSIQEILVRQLQDCPDTSVLPAAFAPIVAKALAKDPAQRYQDVNEMVDALVRLPDVGEQLSRFDPVTLTQVPRSTVAPDGKTPPTPPAVTMDARRVLADANGRRPYEVPPPYQDRYRIPKPASFKLPLTAVIVLDAIGMFFAVAAAGAGTDAEPFHALRALTFLLVVIPGAMLLYKWWATLPVGWRRTTPGRAAGFCFIPLFNLYWIPFAFHGLVIDLNRYRRMFARDMRLLSHLWLIAFWVLFVLAKATVAGGPGGLQVLLVGAATTVQLVCVLKLTGACRELATRQATANGAVPEAVPAYR